MTRVCQLYLADTTFPSWWDAVNWAGEHFRAFRIEHKLDASGVAALLVQGRMAARTIQRGSSDCRSRSSSSPSSPS